MKYAPYLAFLAVSIPAFAQTNCVTSATPPVVRAEGITERIGDMLFTCSGSPNGTLTGNFTVSLNVGITNNISSGNTLTGIVFTANNGSGPQVVPVQALLTGRNSLVFNGVSFTFSAQGSVTLRIAGVRGNATQIGLDVPIVASLGINAAGLALTNSQPVVGRPERGLFVGYSSTLVCAQNGSPLPETISFANLISAGSALASTRITEGFADAFGQRSDFENFNAAAGERIIVRYSGFPQDARLFVPDVVAGSDTVQPTAGGDFELPAAGGTYAPVSGGTLLLARVNGADSNGAGGAPVYLPGAVGSGSVTFNTVSELTIAGGSAYAVYEVVDANSSSIESAQFPTFLGLLPDGNRNATQTTETVFFAPLSTVMSASATEPVPRFAAITPQPDCSIIGDCGTYLPALSVTGPPLQFTGTAGGATQQSYFTISNTGGGTLRWTATVSYSSGSGWLSLDPPQGTNGGNVRVYAAPGNLAAGTYMATINIDGGSVAGTRALSVTFTVAPGPPPVQVPVINSVVNAASFAGVPIVPGSLSTVFGSNFAGRNVTAAFNGLAATVLFSNGGQINLLVPAALPPSAGPAVLIVTVDGVNSAPVPLNLAPFEPAIFAGAILNQDSSVNGPGNGARAGSVIQIFATGLSGSGTITGHIDTVDITVPYYAGPAPGFPGVQQVNLTIPAGLAAMTTEVYVCGTSGGTTVCSTPAPLTVQ